MTLSPDTDALLQALSAMKPAAQKEDGGHMTKMVGAAMAVMMAGIGWVLLEIVATGKAVTSVQVTQESNKATTGAQFQTINQNVSDLSDDVKALGLRNATDSGTIGVVQQRIGAVEQKVDKIDERISDLSKDIREQQKQPVAR